MKSLESIWNTLTEKERIALLINAGCTPEKAGILATHNLKGEA